MLAVLEISGVFQGEITKNVRHSGMLLRRMTTCALHMLVGAMAQMVVLQQHSTHHAEDQGDSKCGCRCAADAAERCS
jgi:hypothetical protein